MLTIHYIRRRPQRVFLSHLGGFRFRCCSLRCRTHKHTHTQHTERLDDVSLCPAHPISSLVASAESNPPPFDCVVQSHYILYVRGTYVIVRLSCAKQVHCGTSCSYNNNNNKREQSSGLHAQSQSHPFRTDHII